MKILIHGDDLEKSRQFFFEVKNKLKSPKFLNGEDLSFDELFLISENTSFFDEEIEVIIENLFSKNKTNTKEFKKNVDYLNSNKNLSLILWEQNLLTKAQTTLLKDFSINEFSIPKKMFTFLDNLRPGNSKQLINLYHELRQSEEAELVLFMIIRQFRLYISAINRSKDEIDELKRMAPWQLSKLSSQVKSFTNDQLLKLYTMLFEIELNQKTGKVSYPLDTSIDFFLNDL